jgi:hypothetical protein
VGGGQLLTARRARKFRVDPLVHYVEPVANMSGEPSNHYRRGSPARAGETRDPVVRRQLDG